MAKFNQSPDAIFTYMDKGSQVEYDAGESKDDGAISSYLWDFGDGTMGSGKKISHEFGANGNPDYHRDSASFSNRCGIGAVRIPALAKSVTIHSRLNR